MFMPRLAVPTGCETVLHAVSRVCTRTRLQPELVPAVVVAGAHGVCLGVCRRVDAEHAAHRAAVEGADGVGKLRGQLAVDTVVDLDGHDALGAVVEGHAVARLVHPGEHGSRGQLDG